LANGLELRIPGLELGARDHFKRHAEPIPAEVEAGVLLPVDRMHQQRVHMVAREIVKQRQLVSGDTRAGAAADLRSEYLNSLAPGLLNVRPVLIGDTMPLGLEQGSQVATVKRADRPGRYC